MLLSSNNALEVADYPDAIEQTEIMPALMMLHTCFEKLASTIKIWRVQFVINCLNPLIMIHHYQWSCVLCDAYSR